MTSSNPGLNNEPDQQEHTVYYSPDDNSRKYPLPMIIYLHGDGMSDYATEDTQNTNFGSLPEQLAAYRASQDIRGFMQAKAKEFFTAVLQSD